MVARHVLVPLVLAALTGTSAAAQVQQSSLPSGLREAVIEAIYSVVRGEDQSWTAPNPVQGMCSTFTAEQGVRITCGDTVNPWSLSLELEAWGRADALVPVSPAEPVVVGRRVEYRRGALTEWYVNDTRGLEQGFTFQERPEGHGPLRVELSIGDAEAEILPGGRDALLVDPEQGLVLHYTGLRAWDSTARALEARLLLEDDRLSIQVEDGGATYPLYIDPWIATEEAKLTGSDADDGDSFGYSVALSGDTALVGASHANSGISSTANGAAWVFVRSGTTWTEQQKLVASDPAYLDQLGWSAALSGDVAMLGAPNHDVGPNLDRVRGLAVDPGANKLFGSDIAGNQLAEMDPGTGTATVVGTLGFSGVEGLDFDPSTGTLYGTDTVTDQLITIDPATGAGAAVGALGFGDVDGLAFDAATGTLYGADNATNQLIIIDTVTGDGTAVGSFGFGSVRALAFDSITGTLYGSDLATDQLITIDPSTGSGTAVGPLGYFNVMGLAFDSATGTLYGVDAGINALLTVDTSTGAGSPVGTYFILDRGTVYVFVRSGTTWSEQQKLTGSEVYPNADFGSSVALSGDVAVIGARVDDGMGGAAYVFVKSGTTWAEQQKLTASDGAGSFGSSIALSGDTVVVGAPNTDHSGLDNAGAAYVFVQSGTSWSEQQKLTASDAADGDFFGGSVGLSGDSAIVGAANDDHAGGSSAGSAYVFVRGGTSWSEEAKLTASDAALGDRFGESVALTGDTAVIGASGHDANGINSAGAAYVFERSPTTWRELQELNVSDAMAGDRLGYSVVLSGDTVLVGAPDAGDTGAAYVFPLCPPAESYCTAGTSASGCQAAISASGAASASAPSGFSLLATGVEGQKDGLFFFGANGKQANPWGNGTSYQCVVPPVSRAGTLSGVGTVGACDGSFAQDLNALWCPTCPKPNKNPGSGAIVQAQLWYRDPLSTSNQTTSLSDAVEFLVCP